MSQAEIDDNELIDEDDVPELSAWEKECARQEAEWARQRAERDAAEAKRRERTYSASSPAADTPQAAISALGRALGRCEDAQEEILHHGKFAAFEIGWPRSG